MKHRMKHGSRGSTPHTEHHSDGRDLHSVKPPHGAKSSGTMNGPRIGPGVLGRVVESEVGRERGDQKGSGRAKGEPHGAYTEE